ncbi:hypothetical protein OSTOST_15656, partial [Ostertagia ostertagi]
TRFGETLAINLSTKPVLTNAFPAATLTDLDVNSSNKMLSSLKYATNGIELRITTIVSDASTKLPSGLLAQDTVFGPALFGKSDIPHLNACSQQVVLACPEAISDIKQELRIILNMSLAAFLTTTGTVLSKEILDNIYVDNVFLAANTEEDALEKIENSRKLFRNIGMNLRDFTSNSEYVNKHIPDVVKGKTGNTKLLGVAYNTESDELLLDVRLSQKQQMTKRELVSAVHKIYDPLGLALPLTLKAKLLMREFGENLLARNTSTGGMKFARKFPVLLSECRAISA